MILFFQYRIWLAEGGIADLHQLKKTLAIQKMKNDQLKKTNEELIVQIKQLQKNNDATEARARNELRMIKKDEVFYQIVR